MKKLTKLTALALALALILGMTAMAGTPSAIVYTDDFDEATTAEWKAGASAISAGGNAYFNPGTAFTETLTTGTRYQSSIGNEGLNGFEIVNGGLQRAESTNNGYYLTGASRQLAYTFPTVWTKAEENKAIVASMGWDMMAENSSGKGAYGHVQYALIGAMVTTKAADGTETTSSQGVMGYWNKPALGNKVNMNPRTQQTHATQEYSIPDYTFGNGEVATLRTVIRPSKVDDEGVTSLDIVTSANRYRNFDAGFHMKGKDTVEKAYGVFYNFQSYVRSRFEDFKMYEVSLDPADFTITSDVAVTDAYVNEDFEIAFSQPIAMYREKWANGTIEDVRPYITVTPAGGEALVYGENYTIEVEEKTSGTAIYDVMKIVPADEWDYATTYTVELPNGFWNVADVKMLDTTAEDDGIVAAVTFTTVAAPNFTMTLEAYKGLSATGTALTALEAGTTYFAVSAIQSEGIALTNGTVRIEILDAVGNVVKYATAKKEFGATAATFGAAFKLEAGQTARAFVVGVNGVATK